MGDERRNGGNGAVVAIVVILGIMLLMGVIVVVGGAAFFFVSHSSPAPLPASSARYSLPDEMDDPPPPEPTAEPAPVVPQPPIMRPIIQTGEKIRFAGRDLTLAEFKEMMVEMKTRTPNLDIRLHVESAAKNEEAFIKSVTDVCRELELNFTLME